MDNQTAIQVESVSKKYRLYPSTKQRLFEALHPFRKKFHKEYWALKDVSLKFEKGATIGIVGKNGSGKSTLLRTISGIIRPTSGRVKVNGRISTLLELGSGFHLEFTGKENVLLTANMMGLKTSEVQAKLPEIQDFADIGEFIDQPVKTYSDGMFAKLAFATALITDPDILLVDEILAVGDTRFQRKCFEKFHEFKKAGKTTIMVTHDLDWVTKHTDRAILMHEGRAVDQGESKRVIYSYVDLMSTGTIPNPPKETIRNKNKEEEVKLREFFSKDIEDRCAEKASYNPNEFRRGDRRALLVDYLFLSGDRPHVDPIQIESREKLQLYLKVHFKVSIKKPVVGFGIKTKEGVLLHTANTWSRQETLNSVSAGQTRIYRFDLSFPFPEGDYFISTGIREDVGLPVFEDSVAMDTRWDLIHIRISDKEKKQYLGLVNLDFGFKELGTQRERVTPSVISRLSTDGLDMPLS